LALVKKDKGLPGKKIQDSAQGVSRVGPGVSDYLAGEAKEHVANLKPYLPQELVGGVLPQISGTEDEAVWNAAS